MTATRPIPRYRETERGVAGVALEPASDRLAPCRIGSGVERDDRADEARDAARAATGDLQAFERLYRRHVARIHSLARRMLGAERADDATQEVFLRAWNKLGSFRGDAPFGAWLRRLARNWMLNEIRRRDRLPDEIAWEADERDALGVPGSRPATETALDLDQAIDELPDGARHVLVLRHFEGLTHAEIAAALDITVGTSKSQLHRAWSLLRRRMTVRTVDDRSREERG